MANGNAKFRYFIFEKFEECKTPEKYCMEKLILQAVRRNTFIFNGYSSSCCKEQKCGKGIDNGTSEKCIYFPNVLQIFVALMGQERKGDENSKRMTYTPEGDEFQEAL
ncbi:hypothetical protein LOAG_07288 [Loa loa]|uniref:Uncharacterized protein n=1 Tax=Loa loa TaxID=7209 RepID=A0A1S0TW41_LOALO|nr:hypothetical protein LOAG_07288 [Loa loa]EFO21204.1 hypothetical protein LOAG_07288 [Loa loa]